MFRKFSTLLLITLLSANLFAIEPPRPEDRPGLRDDATLRSVFFIDSSQGWAVGDRGVVWYTPDGGEHWLEQTSGVGCRLDCVRFVTTQTGWIAGGWYDEDTQVSRGVLLRTHDGGRTWERLANELPRLHKIHFRDHREGIASGDWSPVHLSAMLMTFDGGKSWQPVPKSDSGPQRDFAVANDVVTSLDRAGIVFNAPHIQAPSIPVFADSRMRCTTAGGRELWAAGKQGAIAASRDDGKTWRPLSPNASNVGLEHYDIEAIEQVGGRLWLAGTPGDRVFVKDTAGQFSFAATGCNVPINDLHFIDDHQGWAACSMGTVLATTDGGRTWRVQRGDKRRSTSLFVARQAMELPWPLVVKESMDQGFRSSAVIDSSEDHIADPVRASPQELAQQAFTMAGGADVFTISGAEDSDAYRRQIAKIFATVKPSVVTLDTGLASWQQSAWLELATANPGISRVFAIKQGDRGDIVSHRTAILPAASLVVDDVWSRALAVVQPGHQTTESTAATRLLDRGSNIQKIEGLAHGLPIGAGGLARRLPPQGSRGRLAYLQPQSRFRDWVVEMIDATTVVEQPVDLLASRLTAIIDQIRAVDRPGFLRLLILECRSQGKVTLYQETLRQTADLVPDEPIGQWASMKLAAIDASEEWQQLPRKPISRSALVAHPVPSSPASYGSPFEMDRVVSQVTNVDATKTRSVRRTVVPDLVWRHQPGRLVSQVAALGEEADSALIASLQRVSVTSSSGPWASLAAGELAMRRDTGMRVDSIKAVYSSKKPYLDGIFDETIWHPVPADSEKAIVQFSYDSQYLYVAIRGAFRGLPPAEIENQRQRDANLDDVQRLSLQIDVDRDLMTSFRLEIDQRGRVRDICDGFLAWQPKWFVKAVQHEDSWDAEIAIRRADLFSLPIVPTDAWQVKLEQLQAGTTPQRDLEPKPSDWQLLRFE